MTASGARLDPVAIASHYRRFRVADRILLTGHSHQAWPDVSLEGHTQAWLDAAADVDAKWARAEAQAELVRRGYRRLLGDDDHGRITLGPSTHDLLVRLLSSFDWWRDDNPRIVTTDGEFHSARRQLDRLRESGVEVDVVAVDPLDDLPTRLAAAVDDRTAVVLVSKVLFGDGRIVPDLGAVAAAARRHGTALVVDAYHALNVVDWTMADDDLADAFVLGGGYKYVQAGEGNCFLRWPVDCELRPLVTGWYAEFGDLEHPPDAVVYGRGPERFAGATYDPTSHYRAARVFRFSDEEQLRPDRLRALNQLQVERLRTGIHALDPDPATLVVPDVPLERIGGFLALRSPVAGRICDALRDRGVYTDHRGAVLRLGPAPYVTDAQIDDAVAALCEVLNDPVHG